MIAALEERLSQGLFDRHTKGMTLTTAGEALVPHARLLLFEMAQAVENLEAVRGLRRGSARIGTVATMARAVLPAAVQRFFAAAPGLRIELLEAADDRLITALLRREIDVAIAVEGQEQAEISVIAECRFDDTVAVFCAAHHLLAKAGQAVTALKDVLDQDWVMPARGATPRDLFEKAVLSAGGTLPTIAVETWSPSAMVAFVKQTDFLGWLPRPLFRLEQHAGNCASPRPRA